MIALSSYSSSHILSYSLLQSGKLRKLFCYVHFTYGPKYYMIYPHLFYSFSVVVSATPRWSADVTAGRYRLSVNLKDDISRFQIITKVPYPNKGDRWIEAKRKIDEDWYYWQTALRLVQGSGRSIRSKEDWAKTYVLDSAFGYMNLT